MKSPLEVALEDAARRKGSWNSFHAPTVTRVDLFVVRDEDYDAEEFLRRGNASTLPTSTPGRRSST